MPLSLGKNYALNASYQLFQALATLLMTSPATHGIFPQHMTSRETLAYTASVPRR